jgi:two-component system, OmpR family, phosphate regulon sensor histidine kinase PhoR
MKNFLKVLGSYLFLVLLAIAVLDFFLTPKIIQIVTDRIENEMFSIAKVMNLMPSDQIEKKLPEVAGQADLRVTLIDSSGKVTADSHTDWRKMDNHLNRPEIQQAQREGQGKATRFSATRQESMLYVALSVKKDGDSKGYIRLARPLVEVEKSLKSLYSVIYLTTFIILIPSIVLAIIFSRNIAFRPSPLEKALEKNR